MSGSNRGRAGPDGVGFAAVRTPRGTRRGHAISAETKRRIVAESRAAGAVVRDVARRHGISAETLYRWRYRYPGNGQAEAAAAEETSVAEGPATVEIQIAETVVRVPADIGRERLADIVAAVRAGS